jgi:hypothetical protein
MEWKGIVLLLEVVKTVYTHIQFQLLRKRSDDTEFLEKYMTLVSGIKN